MVVLARTGAITGVGVGALGIRDVTARRSGGLKAHIRTRARAITGVLVDALCAAVSACSPDRDMVGLTCATAVTGVGVGALCG